MSTQKTFQVANKHTRVWLLKVNSLNAKVATYRNQQLIQLTGFYMMTTFAFNELIKYRNALRPWTIKTLEQCPNLFKVSNSDNIRMSETCSASALQIPVGTRCLFSIYETSIRCQGHLMDVMWTSYGHWNDVVCLPGQ